jgi:hypothetical protein
MYCMRVPIWKKKMILQFKGSSISPRSYKNHLMFRRKNYTETPGDISNLYLSQSQIKLALAYQN